MRPRAATHQHDRHCFGGLAHQQRRCGSKFVCQTHNAHAQGSPKQIGATAQIRAELLALRDAGCGVLVVSEELDELFEIGRASCRERVSVVV